MLLPGSQAGVLKCPGRGFLELQGCVILCPCCPPCNKPCMQKAPMFPCLAFCCVFVSLAGDRRVVSHRRVCGGRAAAVDMELLSVVWFSLTPCCALVFEDTGDTTGYSGTLHTPAEKKHFALTCFLLSPETRISQILTLLCFVLFFVPCPAYPSRFRPASAPTCSSLPPSSCFLPSGTHGTVLMFPKFSSPAGADFASQPRAGGQLELLGPERCFLPLRCP